MMLSVSPNEDDIQTALRSFLLSVLPDGTACFRATITGTLMDVVSMVDGSGPINDLDVVLGEGVLPGSVVENQTGGTTGGVGTYTISPNQMVSAPTAMATGVEVYEAQDNLVPESPFPDQVIFTPLRRPRLATNIDDFVDGLFAGSITGTLMTISAVAPGYVGELAVGSVVFGVGVAAGTVVTALGTGGGGVGTYQVAPSQTVTSRALAAGVQTKMQETEIVYQLDVHGPNSGDFSQTISTMFRDPYAVDQFATSGFPISPLYADDPAQRPFVNENQQVENRWALDAHLQANITISVAQQASDVLSVEAISVEAPPYPP